MIRRFFSLPLYILYHPFDGFYEMKHGRKGKTSHMLVLLLLLCFSYSFQKQYAGFAVKQPFPLGFNVLADLAQVLIVYTLFCVGNWSITCLMDGEGKLLEIAMGVAYSFIPMILVFVPATIISNLFVDTEVAFYTMVMGVSIVWFVLLAFVAISTVHNFSVQKTVSTLFLTFIAMLIIVFLLGLFTSLIQQVWVFFRGVYNELIYRL